MVQDRPLTGASRRAWPAFGAAPRLVFQTYNLIPELTARENVLLAHATWAPAGEAETACELLGGWVSGARQQTRPRSRR